MAKEPFHEALVASVQPLWERTVTHPFLAAVADGTLPDEAFATWLVQDYFYVRELVPFMGVLIAKAPEAWRPQLAEALVVFNRELALFRQQAEALGVSFKGHEMAPTCHAYVHYMLATAYAGSFAEAFTVHYAAERAYLDAWSWARERQQQPSRWQAFIDNWSSDAFRSYVAWLGERLDELADRASPTEREAMRRAFHVTVRYEYLFWEMAMNRERWPDEA